MTQAAGSQVGIATRYGLDVRCSNPGGGEIFHNRAHRPRGPPNLMYNEHRLSFPDGKVAGCGVNHPPPSSALSACYRANFILSL